MSGSRLEKWVPSMLYFDGHWVRSVCSKMNSYHMKSTFWIGNLAVVLYITTQIKISDQPPGHQSKFCFCVFHSFKCSCAMNREMVYITRLEIQNYKRLNKTIRSRTYSVRLRSYQVTLYVIDFSNAQKLTHIHTQIYINI